MISEYNRCFDSTPVKDAIIKQELIADTVKTLNRQSLEDAIRAFLDISSPVGILVKYLESPWYRYLTFEINKNTGVMELAESQRAVRLSEIDRSAAQKIAAQFQPRRNPPLIFHGKIESAWRSVAFISTAPNERKPSC